MCLRSRAASSFVAKLEESRDLSRKNLTRSAPYTGQALLINSQTDGEIANLVLSPGRAISNQDNERELVLRLDVAEYNETREYPGLIKLRIDRKERHVNSVLGYSLALDRIAEALEEKLLHLSSEMKDEIEDYDTNLELQQELLNRDDYLLSKGKKEILAIQMKMQDIIKLRSSVIEKFAFDLGLLEIERANRTNAELEKLLDDLVSIAHQLINEIESLIEDGAYDLNSVITSNRLSHSHLLSMLRKAHAKKEVESIQKWEDSYKKWKVLHHKNVLEEFHCSLHGPEFNDRNDRRTFLENVKNEQNIRHVNRLNELKLLDNLTFESISSDGVKAIKRKLHLIHDDEVKAIQVCQ